MKAGLLIPQRKWPRVRRAAAAALAALVCARGAGAEASAPVDPVLDRLIAESLAVRPELQQAEAILRAQRDRVPQAGALPDPILTLGIQNDSFNEIQIGEMETSFYQIMVSQGLPRPGNRGLRTAVARLSAEQTVCTRVYTTTPKKPNSAAQGGARAPDQRGGGHRLHPG